MVVPARAATSTSAARRGGASDAPVGLPKVGTV
jgi:hypothetical protein